MVYPDEGSVKAPTDVGVDTGTDSSSPLNVDRTKTNNSAIMYLYPC